MNPIGTEELYHDPCAVNNSTDELLHPVMRFNGDSPTLFLFLPLSISSTFFSSYFPFLAYIIHFLSSPLPFVGGLGGFWSDDAVFCKSSSATRPIFFVVSTKAPHYLM